MKLRTFLDFLDDDAYIRFISNSDLAACYAGDFKKALKTHEVLSRTVIGVDTSTYLSDFSDKRYPCLVIALADKEQK